jgi:serine/threonine-protein kinase SRPK3
LLAGGDYLFDPQAGTRYTKDEDHIAQIIELMGELPQSLAFSGKYSSRFFNRKGTRVALLGICEIYKFSSPGELRHINKLRFWPLEDVLHDKYEFSRELSQTIASFFNPMLRLHPEKRAGANELVHHRWLDGVTVQGELDVVRRAEEEERARRAGADPGKVDTASNVDALKPVDDSRVIDDELADLAPKLSIPKPASAIAKENSTKSKPPGKSKGG